MTRSSDQGSRTQAKGCASSPAPDEISSSRSPERTPAAPSTTSSSRSRRRAVRRSTSTTTKRRRSTSSTGRYKIRIGDETFRLEEGGFAYLPSGVPHAFLNLTEDPGEIVVVYTPGGGHKFYEELGPLTRNGTPDRAAVAAVFEKYDMTLLGPPLTDD